MSPSHTFDEKPDWDALARYRMGESTAEEAAAVASWLERHPNDAHLLNELDAAIAPLAASPSTEQTIDVEAALQRVHRRLTPEAAVVRPLRVSRTPAQTLTRRHRVQWAIGSLAAAAIIGFFVVGRRDERPVTDARRTAVAGTLQPGGVIRTDVGVRDSVVLSDGTRVLLAPSSRLIVSPSYGRGAREVTLEGMARFSVQHDSAAPFVVHAGNAVIRDVGTEFVVRAPASAANEHVAVAVLEGEVTIAARSSSQTPTSLHAGDRGEMQTGGAVVVERGTANDADVAWTRGALAYRAAPLESVRDDLRRWYGVELQIADSALTSRRLTATFDANDTAEQVLNTIALALGADVERTGTVATLRRAARPK